MSTKSVVQDVPVTHLYRRPSASPEVTVAVITPSYGMERVSYMIPSSHHRYIKLLRLPLHWCERRSTFLEQSPIIIGPKVDLVHTFNHVPVNRNFVVTAEMELPRYLFRTRNWQNRVGLRLLASERCRGIWPLSEAGAAYLKRRFNEVGFGQLSEKLTVFRGAVPPAPTDENSRNESKPSDPLKLLFVGGDGLRKGLRPTLDAVRRLRNNGVDVQITVVGQPSADTYIVPGVIFPTDDLSRALASEPWIRHHVALPNAEVRRLMSTHDLFVMPTIDESLGWVFVEAAMSGLPSISTNVFAIPELVVNGVSGWTIEVELNQDRRWTYIGEANARDPWIAVQDQITNSLTGIISTLAADRTRILRAGKNAQQYISSQYAFDVARPRLEYLYRAAISN